MLSRKEYTERRAVVLELWQVVEYRLVGVLLFRSKVLLSD